MGGRHKVQRSIDPYVVVDIGNPGFQSKVTAVEIRGTRRLRTVPPSAFCWTDGKGIGDWAVVDPEGKLQGEIIRLQPPPGGEERAEALKKVLLQNGAAAVRIDRSTAPDAVVREQARQEAELAVGERELVTSMVAEANTQNRELLAKVVEEAMAEAGL